MLKKRYILFFSCIVFLGLAILLPFNTTKAQGDEVWSGLGTTAGKAGIVAENTDIKANPPTSVPVLIGKIIAVVLSFLGVIFLVLTIYGGFLWMMAQGNEEQVAKAKGIVTSAVVGLALVLSAYAITWFVTTRLAIQTGMVKEEQLN